MADYHKFDPAPEGTPPAGFVHLHVHSDYSLLDSCATLDGLVAKAKRLNMPALALTDHGNMFGALNFEKLCHVNGINPIVGEEFYVAYGSHTEKNDVPFAKAGGHKAHYFHLGESGLVLSEEGNPAGLSSCSGGLRPLVELCVEPAGLCGRCTGVAVPLRVVPSPTGLPSKRGPGLGSFSRADRGIGGVRPVAPPTWLVSNVLV